MKKNKRDKSPRGGSKPRQKDSGFVLKDRTGKVHGSPGKHAARPSHAPARAPTHAHAHEARPSRDEAPRQGKPSHKGHAPQPGKKAHGRPEREKRGHAKTAHGKPGHGKFEKRERFERHEKRGRPAPHRGKREQREGAQRLKATVDKNHKGFAFLVFQERGFEDAFVPPREAESLFHGDRVEVTLDSRDQIFDIRVIEHRFREFVGRYSPHPVGTKGGWVIYERKRAREEVFAPQGGNGAKTGDWVKAKLHFHESGPLPVTAEVTEVYGELLPPSADIGMVAAEYNLTEEHSEASVREAEGMRLEIPGKDLEGRKDLRDVPFITIDGETARDFDDAVYVEKAGSGYVLWVAIADVSHYVTHGSALDKEARSRGTSVYFPEKAFHMLPRALSENLCSLRPNEPRLSMVARMEYDSGARRHRTEVMEAVIQSHRRATYNEIQAEWEKEGKNPEWEYAPHFGLYAKIRAARAARGSIDFDLPEAEMNVAPTGEVISIRQRGRLDAHRLIEEFMIAANEAVTEWMMEREWPFVYRIHEEPAAEKLERFQQLAETVGVRVSLEAAASPKVLADVVRRLEGHPAQALLNTALLRSMKQAIYSATHGIHYGLASPGYTHFTSPIRRYPDLVVHRLLRQVLRLEKSGNVQLSRHEGEKLEKELEDICEHCSYRERLASDAERESIKLKQVRAMVDKLGQEFDAKIVGMIDSGLFAEIPDPFVEGFISRESMMDDFYQFNEDRMIFYGRRKKRTFRVGDRLRIQVLKADMDRRQIDFGMVEAEKPGEKTR